ncbi:MAG: DUF4147 domain-containing protein, partial [Acidobacteriaceae bacterium]
MTAAEAARDIFEYALGASSVAAAFERKFRHDSMPWNQYQALYVVAVGKAALPMLDTLRSR